MTRVRTLLICGLVLSAGMIGVSAPSSAQVAPTEVNEEAVDEFGLERKTGRFTWSTGEIIGIGGEESRVSIVVTGVRSAPNGQSYMPSGPALPVILNHPRLTITPFPVENPQLPGEIDPSKNYVTVDYSGGSHTFECTLTQCVGQYQHHNTLEVTSTGYVFIDKNGLKLTFTPSSATADYPDGRQTSMTSDGVWANNFGYMLRFNEAAAGIADLVAVNRASDYCSTALGVSCSSLTESRIAQLPTAFLSPFDVVDPIGDVTRISWVEKTAKERRPPQGGWQPGDPPNLDIDARYLTAVTLPGSTDPDILITWGQHDPSNDTHDDIRVSSITRNGVSVDYEMSPFWPYGKFSERPSAVAEANELTGTLAAGSRLAEAEILYDDLGNEVCQRASANSTSSDLAHSSGLTVCAADGLSGGAGTVISVPTIVTPREEIEPSGSSGSFSGSPIYELVIRTRVDGELISISKAIRPYDDEGKSRRHLDWVIDALGRRTTYFYNQYDEAAAVQLPDGNGTTVGTDSRGNRTSTSIFTKNQSQEALTTLYSYPAQCAWCNSPLTVTDPSGNVSEYTYNDRGQVLTERGPAPTSGGARPTVVNEYTMRTAYIKETGGSVVAAGPAISMLTRSFTCITSATCDENTPASDKVVTDYDYGPPTGLNNLLLRGMAVTAFNNATNQLETLRTCYTYNYFGERIAETQPKAGLTSCP